MSHKYFQDNLLLYKCNKEDLKRRQDDIKNGDEEEDQAIPPKKKNKGFGLQDSSDEDDLIVEVGKKDDSAEGKHMSFSLELVFINKEIQKDPQTLLSRMVSYEGHPRDK